MVSRKTVVQNNVQRRKNLKNMKSIMVFAAFVALVIPAMVWVTPHAHAQVGPQDFHPPFGAKPTYRIPNWHELLSQDRTADVLAVEQLVSAYSYYNDTHNGPGMASLFTDDGWAGNCVGKKQIAAFFGYNRTAELAPELRDGLQFYGPSHHILTNLLVKVSADGKEAMATATFIMTQSSVGTGTNGEGGPGVGIRNSRMANDGKGPRIVDSGAYRDFFRKTPDGWLMTERNLFVDPHPNSPINSNDGTPSVCGPNAPDWPGTPK
jgi:hypothetical protein